MPYLSPQTLTQAEQRAILRATAKHPRDHLVVSLALGTGLRGRPRAFQTVDVAPDGGLVVEHGDPVRRFHVRTSLHDGSVFAVASAR